MVQMIIFLSWDKAKEEEAVTGTMLSTFSIWPLNIVHNIKLTNNIVTVPIKERNMNLTVLKIVTNRFMKL